MAAIVVNRGLLRAGQQLFESTNYNDARNVQVLSIDDSSNAFAAGDTALNSGGAVTNEFDQAFDATPTESGQKITTVTTIGEANGNFTVRRIAFHDNTAANVSSSSTTLVAGVDGLSLTKKSDFTLELTVAMTFSDNS